MGSRWTMKKRKDDLGPESERTLLARDRSSLASRLMHCVWTSPWPRGLPSRGSASVPRVLTAAAGRARACGEGVRHSALGKKGEESMLQASLETQDGTFQKIRGCACWLTSFWSALHSVVNIRSVVPTFWSKRALFNNVLGASQAVSTLEMTYNRKKRLW